MPFLPEVQMANQKTSKQLLTQTPLPDATEMKPSSNLYFAFIEKQNKQPYRECSTFQNLSPGTLRRKLLGPTGGKNWRSNVTVPDVTNGIYTLIFQPVRHHQVASAQGWLSTVFPKARLHHVPQSSDPSHFEVTHHHGYLCEWTSQTEAVSLTQVSILQKARRAGFQIRRSRSISDSPGSRPLTAGVRMSLLTGNFHTE